jgi:serine/threonine protein kinase/Flp pilus assembly protein TadD
MLTQAQIGLTSQESVDILDASARSGKGFPAMKCPKCHSNNPDDTLFCGHCGAQLGIRQEEAVSSAAKTETMQTPLRELTTGSLFAGRYQIIEELGRGGMGKVYKALDTELNEKIAIKLLKPEVSADEETIERFRNELKTARQVSHKNICRMYHLTKEEGNYYITMEYVPGEDLKRLIRKIGQMPVGRTISIAKQVLEGLAEAHSMGIVHRDLKPQNIMVDEGGNVRIMDFGIARSLATKGITGAGVMIGTPEYMSPEQVEGKPVDQRSDIYSLGIILYEMVTGRVPFEGDTPFTVGVKHKSEPPRDPKELNPQIPADFSALVLRCLAKDKESRYQSAGELLAELTRVEESLPTTERVAVERRPFTSKQITVTFGLKKLLVPAFILVGLIAAGLVFWRLVLTKAPPRPPSGKPSLAVMYFKNNTGDEKLDHWRVAISDLLITDLSQSRYVNVLSADKLFNILNKLDQAEAKSYTSDILKDVATQGSVRNILVGSYAKAGDNFRIDIQLQDGGTGALLSSDRVEGKGEDSIFALVDELTKKIKQDLKLPAAEIAADIDRELEKITTASPEAFKLYVEGRKLHNEQKYRESIQMMEKAVAIDPGFAMAYRSMAMGYSNLLLASQKQTCLKKAFELTDRLSDRERYTIEGDYYRESERSYDKAVEAYERLLELYPDDSIGGTNLGILYTSLEEWDKAVELYERSLLNNPENIWTYLNIVDSYLAKGWPDKARATLEAFIRNYQDNFMIRIWLAIVGFIEGRYDQALAESEKAGVLNPSDYLVFLAKGASYTGLRDWTKAEAYYQELFSLEEIAGHLVGRDWLGAMYMLRGQFQKAEAEFGKGIELAKKAGDKGWISSFHLSLADLYLRSGRPGKALQEYDKALRSAQEMDSLSRQKRILLGKGNAELESGKMQLARKTADDLRALVEGGFNKKDIRYHDLLAGMMAIGGGDHSEAIEHLTRAAVLLPHQYDFVNDHALFLDALALAYFKKGDWENARNEYEKITKLTVGAFFYGDIYARSFYMLGMIDEQLGDKVKARENYQKFLDLWKDADPGQLEIADAKKRLASL